jgi:GT2 family glycosyltransferase
MSAPAPATRPPADWAAVVINWNGAADLPACLAALADQAWPPSEVLVVDNASTDASLAVLRRLAERGDCRVLASPTNLGFAGGANAGIRATGGELVATLNPDVTLRPDWSRHLRDAFAADARLGAAGGKLLYPDGVTIQHAGGRLERPLLMGVHIGRGEPDRGQHDAPADAEFLTGGALMLRRAALAAVGLFDEGFFPAYYEDVDLCLRLRQAGWAVRYVPAATGLHRESASVDSAGAAYYRMIHAARLRFAAKHLPLRELVGRFLPAEAARLSAALQHATGALAADQTGRSVFPAALRAGRPGASGPGPAGPAGQGAAAAPAPAAPAAPASDPAGALPAGERRLLDQLAEVGRRWLVEERPFRSSVPLLGPLIVWLRGRLIDTGPRWHTRQILAQQVEFNAAVYRALGSASAEALAARLAGEATAALLVEQLEALSARQTELMARLAELERRLAALDAGPE